MIKLRDILKESCWKGYKQYGMKKKGKKLVPNCVPVEEESIKESIDFENFKTIVFKFTHAEEETRFQTIQTMLQTFKAIKDPAERKEAVKMLKQSGLIGYLKDAMNYSNLSEAEDKTIICTKCGWSWKLSTGGEDPYTCHKCGFDNSDHYNIDEYRENYTASTLKIKK